jgi:DNA modification methylase
MSISAPFEPPADLIRGDCLLAMTQLPAESIDLVYLDPPFGTGRARQSRETTGAVTGRFGDRWPSTAAYLEFIALRLTECRRLLKPTGSLLLHCDWRHSHRLRLLLDELFGADNVVNHLIWSYGLGGSSPRRFARKHDDILFYAVSSEYWFTAPRIPATSRRMAGLDKKATDVLAIPSLNNMSLERCGWPTQKPLALLRLLVGACCPPGGTLLDPFCGSGTSLVAAIELGRRAIGVDLDQRAIALTRMRLAAARAEHSPTPRRTRSLT